LPFMNSNLLPALFGLYLESTCLTDRLNEGICLVGELVGVGSFSELNSIFCIE